VGSLARRTPPRWPLHGEPSDSCFALFGVSLHKGVASHVPLGEDASRPFCQRKRRVAYDALRTLLETLEVFRPALTRPGFSNLLVVFCGWVLTSGPHAITQALVVTGVAGRRHHEAFHRFFSRGAWNVDEMGRLLLCALLRWLPPEHPIRLVIDDTVAAHKGPKIFGLGTHLDAVRSTRAVRILTFGHCWVVMAVLVPVPFSHRPWALPILLRLYRNEKQCHREKIKHRKKTQLAREMIDVVLSWVDSRRVEVTADQAYCNSTVLRSLPKSVLFLGDMRPDAVLTAPPTAKGKVPGRPRVRGEVLPKPQALADDEKVSWKRISLVPVGAFSAKEGRGRAAEEMGGQGLAEVG
jgi:hypothetical protein